MAILSPNDIMFFPFEPQVQNRFLMDISGVPTYMVKKVTAPIIDAGEIVLDHINVYRKIKGKVRWGDMTVSLHAPVTPSGAQIVMDWIRLSHESVTGRDGYSDFYKKDVKLNILGPVGDIVGEWLIVGAFIKTANFGDFDWSGDAAVSIDLTLAMDYCVLNY